MTQLLSAGFARLFKNSLFWLGNFLLSGFIVFVLILDYRNMLKYPELYNSSGDRLMFAIYQIIGIFASCFTGMFLGTEYKDGTMRNKLVTGRSRTEVYLSNLIVSFAASLFASTLSILVSLAVGVALFGAPELTLTKMLISFGLGVLMLAAFSGIFTLISMLIPSKSAGSVVNILLFFVLVVAATYVLSRLDAKEFITPGYIISIDGVVQPQDPVPNPLYLQGMKRNFYEFFRDLLPTSQGNLLMAQAMERPLVMGLCSLGLVVCTTVSGIFHFHRKDLK